MKRPVIVPAWAIIFASLFCTYLAFIVRLLFFSRDTEMFFPQYVPVLNQLGMDLRYMLGYAENFLNGGTPYIGFNNYPPLAALVFAPLTALPFKSAYIILTFLTIASYVSVALALPLAACKRPDRGALVGLTMAGLLSYGMLLEIQQGQFNLLAYALCAWGIFLFHTSRGRGGRLAGYALFSLAVQLKLFPAAFIFALSRDARKLKSNLARWASIGAVNMALLFALGPATFSDFIAVLHRLEKNNFIWCGNHSIKSLAALMENTGLPLVSYIEPASLVLVAACLAGVLAVCWVRNERSCFKYLIAVCALATMLVPQISHDYKLPAFSMALAFFISEAGPVGISGFRQAAAAMLLSGIFLLHALTLLSFSFKPLALLCNTPVLLGACTMLVFLMAVEERPEKRRRVPPEARLTDS